MNEALDALYQDLILEHARHPHHPGELLEATHRGKGYNPVCSDSVDIYLKVTNNIIEEISFVGNGCVLSQASASMMTDLLKGKSIDEFDALFSHFRCFLTKENVSLNPDLPSTFNAFSGVKQFPVRIRCVTLAWHAVKAALKEDEAL